jgi:hypothetical protein
MALAESASGQQTFQQLRDSFHAKIIGMDDPLIHPNDD